uniref:Uncharacterized protein n=1 Tax=Romanomermis culicivorax TaxID=13658 RepID=A0A915HI58_ROMCU
MRRAVILLKNERHKKFTCKAADRNNHKTMTFMGGVGTVPPPANVGIDVTTKTRIKQKWHGNDRTKHQSHGKKYTCLIFPLHKIKLKTSSILSSTILNVRFLDETTHGTAHGRLAITAVVLPLCK